MNYLVLARRFRPQSFRDVIGQEAILTTLKNALCKEHLAHAYLFSGPRGVGKTTLARLFAKALNCSSLKEGFEPCNACASCREILSGQSLDVIEIDGASNRGIDDIRQINETCAYAPSYGKYKIYLIDEVHMLTKEAFNALLKTLEEPPAKVKFFFATTEPHKVLPTILSRCQRFDLQRLSEEEIVQKLALILSELKQEADAEAIRLIASFSEGSLRDAESLLDQILCFAEGSLTQNHVRSVLGLVPEELFHQFDKAFSEGRTAFAFELTEQLFRSGKDLLHFFEQLIAHYRRLSLGLSGLETLPASFADSAKLYTTAQLFHILDLLIGSYSDIQKSPMQRVALESLLLKILRSRHRIPLESIARRLIDLEQKLSVSGAEPPLEEKKTEPRKLPDVQPGTGLPSASPLPKDNVPAAILPPQGQNRSEQTAPVKQSPQLQPVPFRPASVREEPKQEEKKAEQSLPPPPAPIHHQPSPPMSAGRHDTLLRFAAVELEGTLKMEK